MNLKEIPIILSSTGNTAVRQLQVLGICAMHTGTYINTGVLPNPTSQE